MKHVRGKLRIIDRDRGWRALRDRIYAAGRLRKPHVAVGILQSTGAQAKKRRSGKRFKGPPPTLLDVAHWNEFGTVKNGRVHIPERSFIRGTVDAFSSKYAGLIRRLARSVLKEARTVHQALTLLGTVVQGDIRRRIGAGVPPPNAASTVARKKSSKPLIDTGQLRGSINFEVRRA